MEPMSAATSTTLRPRNRRRTNEDGDSDGSTSNARSLNYLDGSASTGPSPRPRSPIPKPHLPQAFPSTRESQRPSTTNRFLEVPPKESFQTTSSTFASNFLDNPWASLQNLASTLVGNDRSSGQSTPNRSPTRRRQLFENTDDFKASSASPNKWGPPGSGDRRVGAGTRDERIAQVQAKKREALLAANDQAYNAGHYKRRDSDDLNSNLADQEERDQLVYIHKVRPEDTLAGITIKYNCQANVFRKANRLWPNDSVQIRKVVVLPVDACAVRGRKIISDPSPNGALHDFDSSNFNGDIMPTPTAATHHSAWGDFSEAKSPPSNRRTPQSSVPTSPSISAAASNPDEPRWTHDSWVTMDGFHDAVEIARLSRKALGYFPRSRRKSVSLSDLDSPQPSLDLPRPSFQAPTVPFERRPSIAGSKTRSGSGSHLAKGLHGVGGVGTMGNNVRSPGPAQDGLNKMFAAHLPNLAPKGSSESLQSSASHGNGIENVGGAIEGWVRKIATKAQGSFQPPTPGGRSGVGDLIELSEDVFDIGADENERGERPEGRKNQITGWTAEQQEQMLHERFPPRGRVYGQSSRRQKSR